MYPIYNMQKGKLSTGCHVLANQKAFLRDKACRLVNSTIRARFARRSHHPEVEDKFVRRGYPQEERRHSSPPSLTLFASKSGWLPARMGNLA